MENNHNYRYPGVNYFTKEDKDIFCGREEDVNNFYTQVMLSKTLVLHAESGAGKSSLIQAGFLPLLEEKQEKKQNEQNEQNESTKKDNPFKYFPVTVRFDFLKKIKENKHLSINEELLINGTISKIESSFPDLDKIKLPYLDEINTDSLWCIAKKVATKKFKLLLIFDQFEELQGYPLETITYFKKELAELLSSEIPETVYEEIKKVASKNASTENLEDEKRKEFNKNIKFYEEPLEPKIIFVVREDKLGTMSLLSDYFPNILKNNFLLNSLSVQNASLALTKPATVEGEFISPMFKFESDELVQNLITEIADKQTGLVDPIQIQIIATKIEKNITEKAKLNPNTNSEILVVPKDDIPKLGDIITEFYSNCWDTLKTKLQLGDSDFDHKKNNIISLLVVNDRRDLVNAGWIIQDQTEEMDQKIVSELLKSGLLREVPSGNDKFYQLCHDRFIKPVLVDQKKIELLQTEKEEKERNQKLELEREKKRNNDLKALNSKVKHWNRIAIAVVIVCVMLLFVTLSKTKEAEIKTEEAIKEKNIAKDQRKYAEKEKQNAVKERKNAEDQSKKAEKEKQNAEDQRKKAENERKKSNAAVKKFASTYVLLAENAKGDNPSTTDLGVAKSYLTAAKDYLKNTQNESLIKEIDNKIKEIDLELKK